MKKNLRDIVINLISNTIFQIIAFAFLTGSGIISAVWISISSLTDMKVNLSIGKLTFIIVAVAIAVGCLFALGMKISVYIKQKKGKEKRNFDDVDDYYFANYEKHITIYKNGNGIIIHKFTVIVNNVDKFRRIRRKLNIEDGKVSSNFPELEKMIHTNKSERFDKFGFWYYDKDNIISEVKEFYWKKDSEEEDKKAKSNPKELRWVFKINRRSVKQNVPYEIVYAISVPGLAALENGKLDKELLSEEFGDTSSSVMNIDHKIKNLRYIISFEHEVELEAVPQCILIITGQDESQESTIAGKNEYDILYNKYVFDIDSPEFKSVVKINWKYSKVGTV